MAKLVLKGDRGRFQWEITGLTNPFNTKHYNSCGISLKPTEPGSKGPGSYIAYKMALKSGYEKSSGPSWKEMRAGTYTFYGYTITLDKKFWPAGEATVTVSESTFGNLGNYKDTDFNQLTSITRRTPTPVIVGGIEFDALIDEEINYEAQVPEYPVESGFTVSDAVIRTSESVKMNLYLTETPVTWSDRHRHGYMRVQKACQQLEELYFKGTPISVITVPKTYTDMAIETLKITRSTEIGYAREVEITFKKIWRTTSQTATIPASYAKSGVTQASAGAANTSASSGSKSSTKSTTASTTKTTTTTTTNAKTPATTTSNSKGQQKVSTLGSITGKWA